MKIKEYIVISMNNFENFTNTIRSYISSGYCPYFGMTTNTLDKFPTTALICFNQAMVKYEEKTDDKIVFKPEQRKLIDFSVSWHSTIDYMERNENDLLSDGWETFKKESLEHGDGLMCHKIMMVKYEN